MLLNIYLYSSLYHLTATAGVGDDIVEGLNKAGDKAKDALDTVNQAGKDGIAALNKAVNGANVVQLSSMGLFMTVLAIFNR